MGKPRLLIVIRHAQSEGNKNREIHQLIPDHRVKLTDDGWAQAEAAGHRLRALLRPDDTLQFYTSPYRRTRETTEGILRTLTSADTGTGAPSPFSRNAVKVFEEPRIREQDFGNFQPCSSEMERMWQERADYGHFFYRIPNGESAADAYDRISGFNESLWRSFGEADFPSVCVLVTHGLMTRVFLMKWYHWSVEYFEDLRNINHCEFIVMQQNLDNGKYVLQSQLRTWSELKRQRAEAEAAKKEPLPSPQRRNTLSQFLPNRAKANASPPPRSKWGGCVGGCNHNHDHYPRRNQRASKAAPASTAPVSISDAASVQPPPPAETGILPPKPSGNEEDDTPASHAAPPGDLSPIATRAQPSLPTPMPSHLLQGRDGGGTDSGAPTPHEPLSDQDQESDYFDPQHRLPKSAQAASTSTSTVVSPSARGSHADQLDQALRGKKPRRKPTEEDLERWVNESGMGVGKRADALGDEPSDASDAGEDLIDEEEEARREELEGELELERQERKDKSLRGSVY